MRYVMAWVAAGALAVGALVIWRGHGSGGPAVPSSSLDDPHAPPSTLPATQVGASIQRTKNATRVGKAPVLPASDKALNERLDALEREAKAGNADVSYALGMALRSCAEVEKRYIELEEQAKAHPDHSSSLEPLLAHIDEDRASCGSLSSDALGDYGKWIELAAQQGNRHAQLAYAAIFGQLLDSQQHAMDTAWIERYKTNTLQFLTAAASDGSVDALSQLADVYKNGLIAPADPVRAYAYEYAVSQSGLVGTASQLLDLWAKNMTPAQIEQARQLGNSIYQQCCR